MFPKRCLYLAVSYCLLLTRVHANPPESVSLAWFFNTYVHICKDTLNHYGLRSQDVIHMLVPRVRTELGKKNKKKLLKCCLLHLRVSHLSDLVTLGEFSQCRQIV